jgi:hypothetical protein
MSSILPSVITDVGFCARAGWRPAGPPGRYRHVNTTATQKYMTLPGLTPQQLRCLTCSSPQLGIRAARLFIRPPVMSRAFMPRSLRAAPYDGSLSVTTALGQKPCDLSNFRIIIMAARLIRRDCSRTSRTSSSQSTARHRYIPLPLIEMKTLFRCLCTSARVCVFLNVLA